MQSDVLVVGGWGMGLRRVGGEGMGVLEHVDLEAVHPRNWSLTVMNPLDIITVKGQGQNLPVRLYSTRAQVLAVVVRGYSVDGRNRPIKRNWM